MGPRLYLNIETDLTASLVPEDLVQYASSGARRLLYELILCCVYVCRAYRWSGFDDKHESMLSCK